MTERTLEGIHAVFDERHPAWVVVQGDTTTAFAAALAAFYSRLPVAHVEAGLRSGERYSPFPEEINRRLVDQLAQQLFAPTEDARQLLLAEGFSSRAIHVTGNTVVDALLVARERLRVSPAPTDGLADADLAGERMLLVTAHRRESFGSAFESICRALLRIVEAMPDVHVVYPVHPNPNVAEPARRLLGGHARISLLPPVTYLQFVSLMDRAHIILTDSGGVQEEAPAFHKPILVLREVTERPEGISAGVAQLVGTEEERIVDASLRLLRDHALYEQMARGVNPYGDGTAARRIVDVLASEGAADDFADRAPARPMGLPYPVAASALAGLAGHRTPARGTYAPLKM